MKILICSIVFVLLALGSVLAIACTIEDRDRKYNQCVVDRQCRQCGGNLICQSNCLNEANRWYNNGCR